MEIRLRFRNRIEFETNSVSNPIAQKQLSPVTVKEQPDMHFLRRFEIVTRAPSTVTRRAVLPITLHVKDTVSNALVNANALRLTYDARYGSGERKMGFLP